MCYSALSAYTYTVAELKPAPESMTSNGFAKNDDGLGKLHDYRDAVHVTEIDNSCPSQLNSGYLLFFIT